jgi:hypothetical protein
MAGQEHDFEEMIKSPADHFDSPQEVVGHTSLSNDQKLALLRQWEFDEREKSVAAEENMAGDQPNRLSEVIDALRAIGAGVDHAPTKQGG